MQAATRIGAQSPPAATHDRPYCNQLLQAGFKRAGEAQLQALCQGIDRRLTRLGYSVSKTPSGSIRKERTMFKKVWITALAALAIGLSGVTTEVDAKRMGGGRSVGQQSGMSQRAPAQSPNQMNQAGQPQSAQQAAAARQQQAGAQSPARNRWLGPLAGIAAGLGLAALASALGLSEEFGTILLIMLVAMVALFAFRMFMARRAAAGAGGKGPDGKFRTGGLGGRDLAYGGAGTGGLGGDASRTAVPGASGQTTFDGRATGGAAAAGAAANSGQALANFDVDQFVRAARNQFVRLQGAFDSGRVDELREFSSAQMFEELQREIAERGGRHQTTEILTLDAQFLGSEKFGAGHSDDLAAVRFTGLLRESPQEPAQPIDEIWNFTRPGDRSSGWVLAGIEQRGES
jgi:predicted lipid-binding transport protein (Tim44 family)